MLIRLSSVLGTRYRAMLGRRARVVSGVNMSDPRNVAHAKRVTQEKKHEGMDATADGERAAQPGKKPVTKKDTHADAAAPAAHDPEDTAAAAPAAASATLEGSLVVLAQLKDLEFHSRAHLERLAALSLTVEDELKQRDMVAPLAEVYSAQSAFQTKLTTLLEAYKAECDRLQG
jgi:hypothetical protein